jgi:hydrogenase expression/formation protein HypE
MVIEEGFPFDDLEKILCSMEETSKLADVPIITGDTKVVEKNALEKILITTSALGQRSTELENNIKEIRKYRKFEHKWLRDANLAKGDKIIVSGGIGEHGIALLSFREGYGFESVIKSDVYPLNKLINSALKEGGIAAMKDPTRGGLANTLNEWSEKSSIGILIDEERIPIKEGVKSACELLGIDPLEIGNEGKVVMAVVKEKADEVLSVLRGREEGKEAEIIGEVREDINGVVMRTLIGGKRIIEMPIGDPVPRIC